MGGQLNVGMIGIILLVKLLGQPGGGVGRNKSLLMHEQIKVQEGAIRANQCEDFAMCLGQLPNFVCPF